MEENKDKETTLPEALNNVSQLSNVTPVDKEAMKGKLQEMAPDLGKLVGDTIQSVFNGEVKGIGDLWNRVVAGVSEIEKKHSALPPAEQNQLPESDGK